jgi:hypothetical protein
MIRKLAKINSAILEKASFIVAHIYCCFRKDRFVTRKFFVDRLIKPKISLEIKRETSFTSQKGFFEQAKSTDNYRKNISTYGFESTALNRTFSRIDFHEGSPLDQTKTFSQLIYMPHLKAFYSLEGELIDYSCQPENVNAPNNINVPGGLRRIRGPFIYGGHLNKHYGHFLVESICRLWYLKQSELNGNCRVIFFEHYRRSIRESYIDIFMSSIFDKRDFITLSHPAILEEVTIPYPSFILNRECHSVHRVLPEFVAERCIFDGISKTDQPLYFSRTRLNRSNSFRDTLNEDILEAHLIEKGFAVVYPETIGLREQIALINKHRILVGICGSALHSILFSRLSSPSLVCLSDKRKIDQNFIMVDAIKQAKSTYISAFDTLSDHAKKARRTRQIDVEASLSGLRKIGLL